VVTDWFDRSAAERDATFADYMQNVAHARIPVAPQLPDPAVLWFKAQIVKRWDAERRAQAPLDVMEPVQVAIALVAAMVLFAMSLPSLMRVLALLRV
jgi:hypothetical protein